MNEFRVFLTVIVFFVSSYLVYDLFANGFDWAVLIATVIGYISAHYIWPKEKESDSIWYELLEFVIDLPYRTMAYSIRTLGRVFKNSDGDIGIDL